MRGATDEATVRAPSAPRPIGLLAVCAAILCFSSSSTLIRKAGIPGPTIALWRMIGSVPIWWAVLWFTERGRIRLHDVKRLIVPGVFFGLNLTFFFEGVTRTSVANAEFIASLTPLLLIPAGALFFKERIIFRALAFGLVSVVGIALVLLFVPSDKVATWSGNAIVAGSTFAWSGYLLTARRLRREMSVQRIMAAMTPVAALTVLPIVALRGDVTAVTWNAVPYIAGLSVLTGTLAHGFIVLAQQTVPVGTISLLQVAQPGLAVGWAVVFLDQDLRWIQVVGMVLVIVGLVAVVTMTRRAAPLPEAVELDGARNPTRR